MMNNTKNDNKKQVKKNNDAGVRAFLKGFTFALDGIIASVKSERNLRIHLVFLVYVYIFSAFYDFSKIEYVLLTMICGMVVFSEIVNTAIEALSDAIMKEFHPHIKLAKDAGAGAVLVLAIMAVICGVLLFWDVEVFKDIIAYFIANPLMIALLLISLVFALLFIRGKKSWRED